MTFDISFRIDPTRAQIYVNSLSAPLTTPTGLAANISFVSFSKGAGTIIYNDRQPLPEQFTDPSPYQSYINQWITVQSQLTTNALTLSQAQGVKNALIAAIYATKRQLAVSVTVSGTPYQWDASDQAVARMSTIAALAYIGDLNIVAGEVPVAAISVPTIQMLPVGGTALVTLLPSNVKAIMQAIATQNASAQLSNALNQSVVNGYTNIDDVIAYDATAGW